MDVRFYGVGDEGETRYLRAKPNRGKVWLGVCTESMSYPATLTTSEARALAKVLEEITSGVDAEAVLSSVESSDLS